MEKEFQSHQLKVSESAIVAVSHALASTDTEEERLRCIDDFLTDLNVPIQSEFRSRFERVVDSPFYPTKGEVEGLPEFCHADDWYEKFFTVEDDKIDELVKDGFAQLSTCLVTRESLILTG